MPFSILALDFHNTIYDETLEYGLAIDAAVSACLVAVPSVTREQIYAELAIANRELGSDWDDDAWEILPSLKDQNKTLFEKATATRHAKSKELTLSGFYDGIDETLTALKLRGVRIYVVTEAAADAGMRAIEWLGLNGIVDGVYSYPSRKAPAVLKGTYHKPFMPNTTGHLRKPHPFLLAAVVLDEAIRRGEVPADTQISELFEIKQDEALLIAELPKEAPVQQDITARLVLKETSYSTALKRILGHILYVGDSKFRDGMLARNAGVAFGYAAYGKKGHDSEAVRKSLDIMYATTGWDKEIMKLTQEAGRSETVSRLQPDFTFENSLSEALGLFI